MNETLAVRQTKFNNGEISPMLYGEASHPKYAASLRTCRNWVPTPQGALVKRAGTTFIVGVKDLTYTPRLIPFVFSDGQSFVLEVGHFYVRFFYRGQYVGVDYAPHDGPTGTIAPYELATPFSVNTLPYLKFAQVGDVITITYGGQAALTAPASAVAPQDIRHTPGALAPWTITATPLKIPAGVVTWTAGPTDAVTAWSGAVTYSQGDRVYMTYASGVIEWVSIQNSNLNNSPPAAPTLNFNSGAVEGTLYWMPAADLSHHAATVEWAETVVVQDANGITYESQLSPVLSLSTPLGIDRPRPFVKATYTLAAGYTELYMRAYRRSKNGVYGWVMDHTNSPAYDDGHAPNFSVQPPYGTDPFLVRGVDSYPSVVGYLDQRRLFAASVLLPSTLFMSKIGDFYNYDSTNVPGTDVDALVVTVASEVMEQVRAFVPMRRGLVLTSQGEFAIAGATGGPVSKSSLDLKRQSRWGSSWVSPIVIGTGVIFNTAKSDMIRDLYPLYGLYADIWDGQDLTVMSRHLFDNHTVRNMAFQSTPYPVDWVVRDDGVLLSMTYQHAPASFGQQIAEGVVAWAAHTTGVPDSFGVLDSFEEICVVPEPPEDAVYVVVRRRIAGSDHRYVERLGALVVVGDPPDGRYGEFLDSSITYDGHNDALGYLGIVAKLDSATVPGSVDPANYAIGSQVYVTVAGGPFVAEDADPTYPSAFVFDEENVLGLGKVRARVIHFVDSTKVLAELDTACTQAQVNAWALIFGGNYYWSIAKARISAPHLRHLSTGEPLDSNEAGGARGVICLADGDVQLPDLWAVGTAYLRQAATVIRIGLAYNSDAELLDLAHPSVELRNKFKNVVRIGFEVANTRDMWAGRDSAHLTQWKQRQVADAYGPIGLQTGYFEQLVTGDYNKNGRAFLRHFQPLPAVLTAVLREVRLGDS